MKKKLLSLGLMVVMLLSLAAPVHAAEKVGDMTIDKVRYYDVGSEKFEDGVLVFAKELLSADYDGSTEGEVDIASWWQRLGFSIMKQHGRDTETEKFRTQMNAVMLNGMGYKIGAEKSYSKSHTNDDNTYNVYSSGLKNAASIKAAGSAMENQIYQYYESSSGERDKSDAVASNKDLSKLDKSQPVYWMTTGAFKTSGTNKKGHYQALGVVFSDFKISTILPEDKGDGSFYTVEDNSSNSSEVVATDVKNLSLEAIEASQAVTDKKTITASSEINGSESYGFEESISVSSTVEGGTPLMSVSLTVEAGFTASQTIESGWSKSESQSEEKSSTSTVTVTLPAHTQVMITQKSEKSEVVTTYDCPVALSFSVRVVEYTLDPSDNDADAKTKTLLRFDGNARKQILQRGIVEKNLTDTVDGINWNTLHKNNGWIIDILAYNVPMSSTGATFTVQQNTVDSEVIMLPIYALTDIKVKDGTKELNLSTGDSIYIEDFALTGTNEKGAEYYGFNDKKGHWILLDAAGQPADSSRVASMEIDAIDGRTKLVAGTKTGVAYLKYVIDEDCYTTSSSVNDFITNKELDSTAIIKVNVTGETPFIMDDKGPNNLDTELPDTVEYVDGENGSESALKGFFSVNDPENLMNKAMTDGKPFTVYARVFVPVSVKSTDTGIYEQHRKHNMIASLGDTSFGYRIFYNSEQDFARVQAYIGDGSKWDEISSSDLSDDFFDKWHTIAVAYTGTELKLYIDGETTAQSEAEIIQDIYNSGDPFSIGYDPQIDTRKSELTFEHVAVFDEALTAEETVDKHYSGDENVLFWMDCSKFGEVEDDPIVNPPIRENPFEDVKESDYYYDSVLWALEKGVTAGLSDTIFAPNANCTRGQVVTFLWRVSGCPEPTITEATFKDVPKDTYYYKAILWAVENNITSGYNADTFGPEDQVTRGQFVSLLWRLKGNPEPTSLETDFADLPDYAYYYKAVLWAAEHGIAAGMGENTFAPDASCTRGQVVTFLYRAYK